MTEIAELTTDLYYDLLEKFVALQSDYNKVVNDNQNWKFEAAQFKAICKDKTLVRFQHTIINECIGISGKNGFNYKQAVKEMKELKITS